jgi:hypothetical protein
MCFNACTISTCNSGKPKINPTYQNCRIDEEYFRASRNPLKLSFLSFSTKFFQPLKNPLKLSFFLHRICSKRKNPLNLPLFLSFFTEFVQKRKKTHSRFLSFFTEFVQFLKNALKLSSFCLHQIC